MKSLDKPKPAAIDYNGFPHLRKLKSKDRFYHRRNMGKIKRDLKNGGS